MNYQKIVKSFIEFGIPTFDITEANFLYNEDVDVFSFGVPPVSRDLMTKAKGLNFKDCFERAQLLEFEGIQVRVLHLDDLIKAKKASKRPKDQDDIDQLTSR